MIGPADCGDNVLCDVFTPCMGYVQDALYNDDEVCFVTCLWCLTCGFELEVVEMNLGVIEHLNESDLYEHFRDRGVLTSEYDT